MLEAVGELLIQCVCEALAEFAIRIWAGPLHLVPSPALAAIGHAALGACLGALSLALVPTHVLPEGLPRLLNVIITPALVGLFAVIATSARQKHGSIHRFSQGYLFALCYTLARFIYAL